MIYMALMVTARKLICLFGLSQLIALHAFAQCPDISIDSVNGLLRKHHLNRVSRLAISLSEAKKQEAQSQGGICFLEALDQALTSFMTDGSDRESPVALTISKYLSWTERPELMDRKAAAEKLTRKLWNDPDTELELITINSVAQPENRESVEKYWIFYLYNDYISDHFHWAMVDRSGQTPTFNYGFN